MTASQITMLVTMAAYLFAMVGVGIKLSEKNETMGDFYLGGRQLGPLVTAMSAEASDMSSYLLMGLPGLAYLSGIADVGWTVIGLAAGTYLNWLIVAKRLRSYTGHTGSITLPEFSRTAGGIRSTSSPSWRRCGSSCSLCRIPRPALRPAASCSALFSAWTIMRQ